MKTSMSMLLFLCGIFAVTHLLADTKAQTESVPKRNMNVSQGPEAVFDTDVTEVMPDLKGAVATKENGRVGNELVFWGYRLANGDSAYFYACANLEGVDCALRISAICPVQTQVITQSDRSGQLSRFTCDAICEVRPGMVLPCCKESMESSPMVVGLVKCQ